MRILSTIIKYTIKLLQRQENSIVYQAAAQARSIPREGVFEPRKKDDDDLGYAALAKPKKKGNKSGNREKFQHVDLGPDGRSMQGGNLTVVRKVKKGSKNAAGDDGAPVVRERAMCGCQARLHPFVNNCLRCGRIVCLQEDVGPCFFCGHLVTPQGVPQVPPFSNKPTPTVTPTPTPTPTETPTPGKPTSVQTETERKEAERSAAGLKKAQDNLARLLQFDRTMAERTTVYDDQADYFDMSNRWISAEERKKLAQKEAALMKSKQTASSQLVLDFAGRAVVASTITSEETHQRFKEQLVEQMQADQAKQKMMDREEAEEHQRAELERIKGHIKQRPDGSIFVVPSMDIPAPEFVSRQREAVAPSKGNAAKKSGSSPATSNKSQPTQAVSAATGATSPGSTSLSSSTASLPSIGIAAPRVQSRLQTDFYPEVEIDNFDMLEDVVAIDEPVNAGVLVTPSQDANASVKIRGVVESFPGKVWSMEDRLEMIEWMQSQGGNFYMWAPFDDPMHRRLWNHLFSDDEALNMKATIAKCAQLGVEFNLAIRPHSIDFRSVLHTDALARKILQAYEQCGCRSFSILFSEEDRAIPQGCRSLSSAQTELVNTLVQVVDEFVKLKSEADESSSAPSDAPQVRWLFAPTMSTSHLQAGQEVATLNYLRELNKHLDKRIQLLWSGPELPAASLDNAYLTKVERFFGDRSLFFWDRLPQCPAPYELPTLSADAFDYALHQNQFIEVYRRRSPIMGKYFAGGLVSTMSAPVPSRVLLATALQFFKDASTYNPDAALAPVLQEHVLAEKNESLVSALSALIRLIPGSPMNRAIRQPGSMQSDFSNKDERAFYVTLRSNLSKIENAPKVFPHRDQFTPMLNLLREVADMNLAYLDFLSNPKGGAAAATKAIRALRNTLIPVLYTEYDLAHYRTSLYTHTIPDKSLRGDVQRTFTKFKAANSISPKDLETKELVVRLATEATLSMRELESYLISEYNAIDIKAWRIFLNHLFYRADSARGFLYKIPPITSAAASTPNVKILEQRIARIKARLIEEDRLRSIAVKFKVMDPKPPTDDDDDSDSDDAPTNAPSSSNAASSSAVPSSSSASGPAKKVFPTEIKKLPVPGMRYIRDFLSPEAEAQLLADIDSKEWDTELSRRVQQYGYKFDHRPGNKTEQDAARLEITTPMPQFLKDVADMLANGRYVEKPDQVIINEYKPGQGIRQHIDNPAAYDDGIVSISLGSPIVMDFEHKETGEKASWLLEPRSLLIFTKDSRSVWTHGIAQRNEDIWEGKTFQRERRVALTLRKVKFKVARALYDALRKKK